MSEDVLDRKETVNILMMALALFWTFGEVRGIVGRKALHFDGLQIEFGAGLQ